ncbi:dipeptide ABC transporter ATP-binding protein [Actinospica robiniae]|uniref:dipeptide ABC transporter ATP-binding protein n=1 Tax=Actinospica robiniae TaxID=304901 RepID=UPI0004196BBE|nr:ABC transporter ATP-binding protein [Actinospica robiniae]
MTALSSAEPLVEISGLRVTYRTETGAEVAAVRGVDLTLEAGQCVALVGESGSGKSSVGRSLLGLAGRRARVEAERFRLLGRDAAGFDERDWRGVRGRQVGLVPQDPLTALDPLRRIGDEIGEAVRLHHDLSRGRVRERVHELLERVHMPDPEMRARQYPHELSGGQRQRALIAATLAGDPRILVADEPTASLDVTVQAALLDLLAELKARGTPILLISHDLGVVARLADHVSVLQNGAVVESGPIERLLAEPRHPYARTLIEAVPRIDAPTREHPAAANAGNTEGAEPILAAAGLTKSFRAPDGTPRRALRAVDFAVRPGESVGVAGESGSGKTTLVRLLLGLTEPDGGPEGGRVLIDGRGWRELDRRERLEVRSGVQWVPQDPLGSFDPGHTVGRVLSEALTVAWVPRRERPDRVAGLLAEVGLSAELRRRRPIELSGGQRQRVAIARALAPGPRVLLCDEPVSALDVTVQAQVLDLLEGLRRDLGLALVFVSHDLAVIRRLCERVVILADGRVVEEGPTARVLDAPAHCVTRALVDAVPRLTTRRGAPEAAA